MVEPWFDEDSVAYVFSITTNEFWPGLSIVAPIFGSI